MKESGWKEYFNKKADTFGGSVKTSDYFNEKSFYIQRERTLKWLGEMKNLDILDAGCGVGAFTETLTGENNVSGVDFSEKSLEYARKRGLKGYCGDLAKLPFEDKSFDLVLCIGVIQLIEGYEKVLKELARVTRTGGIMLVETLNRNSTQRKLLSVVDKSKKFDIMYTMDELSDIYTRLNFNEISFMNLYHPCNFVTYCNEPGFLKDYFSTSFAVKGRKKG